MAKKTIFLFITSILTLYGCKSIEAPRVVEWYGDYVAEGHIYSQYEEELMLVEGIRVEMFEIMNSSRIQKSICFSDENGFYRVINRSKNPYISNIYELSFKDENGVYKDTTITLTFINENFADGDGNNYLGKVVFLFDINLERN